MSFASHLCLENSRKTEIAIEETRTSFSFQTSLALWSHLNKVDCDMILITTLISFKRWRRSFYSQLRKLCQLCFHGDEWLLPQLWHKKPHYREISLRNLPPMLISPANHDFMSLLCRATQAAFDLDTAKWTFPTKFGNIMWKFSWTVGHLKWAV